MPGNQKPRARKHRGTQTGSVTRSQRSRPRSRQEAMAQARTRSQRGRGKAAPVDRRDGPPTWSGAIKRGLLMSALLFPVVLLFGSATIPGALALCVIAAIFYVPMGYLLEKFLYDRRRAKQIKERQAQQAAEGKR
jgi:antibiotic biosynthesis monooxygenase (ABM) superfamily enzyme